MTSVSTSYPSDGSKSSFENLPSYLNTEATSIVQDEKQANSRNVAENKVETSVIHTQIPSADGGRDAWLFLAGCFVFEALVWGFPFSFGVFQSFYTSHAPFSTHPNGIAAIGTCSSGVMYLWAPVSLYILDAWPSIRRLSSIVGLATVVLALTASSFATQVWHLILTQGVMYAIGGSFLYVPTMFYLDEWFVQRKGLAFGIMWAGVGSSGLIFPFLLNFLLERYGHATTIRIWVAILLSLCTPLIYFVKPRLPPPPVPPPRQPISYAFLTSRTHLALQCANILESLGFFIPSIYLPLYASSLALAPYTGILLLALLNASSVLGAIFFGALCDRLPVTTVIALSTLGAATSVFILWGLATHLELLVVFALAYGFFAGGFSAIWTGMMRAVQRAESGRDAKMGTLMGLFAAGRGVGAVLSGPVSEVLLARWEGWLRIMVGVAVGAGGNGGAHWGGRGGAGAEAEAQWRARLFGYGTKYGVLIVFTGVSAMCGLVAFAARDAGGAGSARVVAREDVSEDGVRVGERGG